MCKLIVIFKIKIVTVNTHFTVIIFCAFFLKTSVNNRFIACFCYGATLPFIIKQNSVVKI